MVRARPEPAGAGRQGTRIAQAVATLTLLLGQAVSPPAGGHRASDQIVNLNLKKLLQTQAQAWNLSLVARDRESLSVADRAACEAHSAP